MDRVYIYPIHVYMDKVFISYSHSQNIGTLGKYESALLILLIFYIQK